MCLWQGTLHDMGLASDLSSLRICNTNCFSFCAIRFLLKNNVLIIDFLSKFSEDVTYKRWMLFKIVMSYLQG